MAGNKIKRREFLKKMGLGAGALGALPWIGNKSLYPGEAPAEDTQNQETDWQQIDDDHQAKVTKFLSNIGSDERFWDNKMVYTMDGDVKVFEITVSEVMWATEEGNERPAFAYNGSIPGQEIRATEGDRVRFVVHNEMDQSTSIHWHGVDVPNDQDGVPFITQPVIAPGETYTYEYTIPNYGSHMYHAHHNSLEQVISGLLGAFIIEPLDKSEEPEYDSDYTMILNDSILGFTINGRSFPYTQPIIAKVGEKIRIRYMNEGLMIHPMHLHGQPMTVFAKDGYNLPAPYKCDTINIAPGERYDVIVEARAVGKWAFHCHILSHVETRQGLFGMVTSLVVVE